MLFSTSSFYTNSEKWRHRIVKPGELHDVYDGRMWQQFIAFEGEPFLSEAWQPWTYSQL